MKEVLEKNKNYQHLLFRYGYLITDEYFDIKIYPFYCNWKLYQFDSFNIYVHNEQSIYMNDKIVLIGNSYNPIDLIGDEMEIITQLKSSLNSSYNSFFEELNKLSGNFVMMFKNGEEINIVQDCCGIMQCNYGKINNHRYFSSHSQLIADLKHLSMSNKIRKYVDSKFYKIGIRQLCGIDTPFDELTMMSANTFLKMSDLSIHRFYPLHNLNSEDRRYDIITSILKNSMAICAKKWKCSVSLTGGVDSKMTLSASKDYCDQFDYFSFISSPAEKRDAIAAHEICENLGLNHRIIQITEDKNQIKDFDLYLKILDHNTGHICKFTDNEARKIIFLATNEKFNMEIKSHISEIGRAFYYKKLGKSSFSKLTPRHMSNLAKRNFFNRFILHDMDQSYKKFIKVASFNKFPNGYDETDMFYWENRMSAWSSITKQTFEISHNTTIIYNNRILLEEFLKYNLEDRIKDNPQIKVTSLMWKELVDLNINNLNTMEKKPRILLEKVFFVINSLLPF